MLGDYIILPDATVRDAIEQIDRTNRRAVFIVDQEERLLGIFTDGDMRKYVLANGDLNSDIASVMNPNPTTYYNMEDARKAIAKGGRSAYPVINMNNKLIGAVFNTLDVKTEKTGTIFCDTPLIIMAGGKGTRLYPYTKILPKALIPIGDVTISERIISQFRQYGCREVYFILNHKAGMVKAYYNDLEKDYNIHFIEETEYLGTGGGLRLLKGKIVDTFILSNCDVLINGDLECAYKTHKEKGNLITFICAMKNLPIPYGVINTDLGGNIIDITEKPEFSFLTNTGVYIVEPEAIDYVRSGEYIHFPDIAKRCMKDSKKTGVFPISEKSWMDMGQIQEMNQMLQDFEM